MDVMAYAILRVTYIPGTNTLLFANVYIHIYFYFVIVYINGDTTHITPVFNYLFSLVLCVIDLILL